MLRLQSVLQTKFYEWESPSGKKKLFFLKDGEGQAEMFLGLFHICIAQAVRHLKLSASGGVRKRGTQVFANKYHLHRGV